MLKIKYTDEEEQQLNSLLEQFLALPHFDAHDVPKEAIDLIMKIHDIQEIRTKRAEEYYKSRLDELADDIEDDLKAAIVINAKDNPDADITPDWKNTQMFRLEFFLGMLNERPDLRKRALQAIEDTYNNREEIIKNFNAPAVKAEIVRPKQYISPNTKASNKLFGKDNERYYIDNGMRTLAAERQSAKKEINVSLFIAYDEKVNRHISMGSKYKGKFLTPFDRVVYDAVIAHYLNGNEYITTNMIYQVISGNADDKASNNPVPKSLSAAISESIDRLFHSYIEIDASEQAKAYGFKEGIYKGHLINCSIVEASLNGQIVTCAHICEPPVLYTYAHNCGQVINYDVSLLDVPSLENSPECVVLKTYLMQRIQIMRHNANFNRTILFETLYELLNVEAKSEDSLKHKRKQIRDHVIKCLDFWQAEGLISGYELNKHGKSIVSVMLKVKLMNKNSLSSKLALSSSAD